MFRSSAKLLVVSAFKFLHQDKSIILIISSVVETEFNKPRVLKQLQARGTETQKKVTRKLSRSIYMCVNIRYLYTYIDERRACIVVTKINSS